MKKYLLPILSVFIFLIFLKPIDTDGDFFQHANIGRYVITRRALPRVDDLTFTAADKPYVAYAWATGVVFYLLYSAVGPNAVSVFVALVAVLTFFLLFLLLKSLKISSPATFLTLSITAVLVATRWPSRPEIMTYPFVLGILLINQFRGKYPKLLLLFPFIILLWANFYGSSVLIGLGILTLIVLFSKKSLLLYTSVFFSYLLALVNGYGTNTVFFIQRIPRMTSLHGDWSGLLAPILLKPTNYNYLLHFQYTAFLYVVYLITVGLFLVRNFQLARRHPIFLSLAVTLLMPFQASRVLPLAIILSAPLLAVLLNDIPYTKKSFGIYGGISILFISLYSHMPAVGLDQQIFSPRLVAFLKTYAISGRLFNTQRIGSFLSYSLYPQIRVYTDTRDDLFIGTGVLEEIQDLFSKGKDIVPLLASKNVDAVVADISETVSYKGLFSSPDWTVIFVDDIYLVAVPTRAAIEKKLPTFSAIDLFSKNGIKEGANGVVANREYLSIWTANPSVNNSFNLAKSFIVLGNADKAIELLQKLRINGKPNSILFAIDRDSLLSDAYFAKRDCTNTKLYLNRVQREAKGKLIFSPRASIPTPINKGYAFYYMVCEKNVSLARTYLQSYLSRETLSITEQVNLVKEFNALALQ